MSRALLILSSLSFAFGVRTDTGQSRGRRISGIFCARTRQARARAPRQRQNVRVCRSLTKTIQSYRTSLVESNKEDGELGVISYITILRIVWVRTHESANSEETHRLVAY